MTMRTDHTVRAKLRPRSLEVLDSPSHVARLALVLAGAYLTAVLAQVRVPLPFTPVPLTGQVLAVMLVGGLLRPSLATASQILYVTAGICGLPWYAGGGCGYQFGPNGGYILGFVGATLLIGTLLRRRWFGASPWRVGLAMLAGLTAVYILGATQFAIVMRTSASQTFLLAVAPFVIGDVFKIVIAVPIVCGARFWR